VIDREDAHHAREPSASARRPKASFVVLWTVEARSSFGMTQRPAAGRYVGVVRRPGPVFARRLFSMGEGRDALPHAAWQATFAPLLFGVALAILLTLLLKETGPAARRPVPVLVET
jgi:hypothetical protein